VGPAGEGAETHAIKPVGARIATGDCRQPDRESPPRDHPSQQVPRESPLNHTRFCPLPLSDQSTTVRSAASKRARIDIFRPPHVELLDLCFAISEGHPHRRERPSIDACLASRYRSRESSPAPLDGQTNGALRPCPISIILSPTASCGPRRPRPSPARFVPTKPAHRRTPRTPSASISLGRPYAPRRSPT